MSRSLFSIYQFFSVRRLLLWALLLALLSVIVGSLVAFFLWLLDVVTQYRYAHEWLVYLLPLAGVCIYFTYKLWGKNAAGGNNLVIDEIHEPGGGVPARMTPLVLGTTIVTHLFGGSAGREGTAVQMGGSIAGTVGRLFRLEADDTRILLMAGIAAGFGAVFGTPVAGAVFALEVLAIGAMRYGALLPCFTASVLADVVTTAWGIHHVHYHVAVAISDTGNSIFHIDVPLLLKSVLAGIAFGFAAYLFAELSHTISSLTKRLISPEWLIPVAGGVIIIGLCYMLGTTDYLGLGVTGKYPGSISIVNAFHAGGVASWSWLWKLLFTAITLSTGFKGGEVTPLFFIGAALGNVIAVICGAPVDIFAAMGFLAVFAAAANTPLACTIMGIELFGGQYTLYFAVACFVAYHFSGHSGIYTSQRIYNTGKGPAKTLKQIREERITRNLRIYGLLRKKWKNEEEDQR
jgi:H+/Cl- antiporter ClcA